MAAPNDDVLPVVTVQDIEGVAAVDRSNSASDAADRKAFATIQAKFALKEVSLVLMADGSMFASKWGQIIVLPDMAHALKFLDKIGGAQ